MDGKKRRTWLGGYVRTGANGKDTYIIEKWIRGEHFHVSTRCNTERAAIKQYERFEVNPYGFSPLAEGAEAVMITPELVEEFGAFMRDVKKDSRPWIRTVVNFLGDWTDALGKRDLRNLNVQRDLKPMLARWRSQRQRVEAIKSFCTWLRTEKGLLNKANDATQDFRIPAARAEKTVREKVVSEEHIRAVLPLLTDATRDMLFLQLGTAWHIAECRRFATDGIIARYANAKFLAGLTVKHKNGDTITQPVVLQETLDAAERIRARRTIPINETLASNMRDACDAVRAEQALNGVPQSEWMPHWRLGQMRHTVLTWAYRAGASEAEIAKFAHHASPATTRKFYLHLGVPVASVPVLRLVREDEEKRGAG